MWTVFLDIDGTLMRTQGAGLRAIQTVMNRRYGIQELPKVAVHGRTDHGIWNNLFSALSLVPPKELGDLIAEYCDLLEQNLIEKPALVLPGVKDLVRHLHDRTDVAVGLLTGNAKRAAEIKMELANLSDMVQGFGGYGDVASDRNHVAAEAVAAARQHLGGKFEPEKMWVIGDSDRDIRCARHVGARVLSVATGVQTMEELEQFGPDIVVNDFSENSDLLASCFE